MSRAARLAHRLGRGVERAYDVVAGPSRRRAARHGDLELAVYRGFGTRERLELIGRVLVRRRRAHGDSPWASLANSYRRFVSRELPGVRVAGRFAGAESETVTDAEGYFRLELTPPGAVDARQVWHEIELHLPERPDLPHVAGRVLVPGEQSRFAVVSDIDDTILPTGTESLLRMTWTTILRSPARRVPFPGVAAFYRALERGGTGVAINPFFYVSSSPWNLYELLDEFIERHDLPAGPLMLRDLGLDERKFAASSHAAHKRSRIEAVLATYPELPFILIGDSAQSDPAVFAELAQAHAGRIRAVYIRRHRRGRRNPEAAGIAARAEKAGVPMQLVESAAEAAEHAARHGFIAPADVEVILNATLRHGA